MEHLTRPAAFLDRDGTLNERPAEHQYVSRLEDFKMLPGALAGMSALASCGFTLVVASNQRGVARGLVSERLLREVEDAIQLSLAPEGVEIAGFYYCPHELDDPACDCRKPMPGLLLRAADELGLDLASSWMVGDSSTDVEAGIAAGCSTAYIGPDAAVGATLGASSLEAAAALICRR